MDLFVYLLVADLPVDCLFIYWWLTGQLIVQWLIDVVIDCQHTSADRIVNCQHSSADWIVNWFLSLLLTFLSVGN